MELQRPLVKEVRDSVGFGLLDVGAEGGGVGILGRAAYAARVEQKSIIEDAIRLAQGLW